MEKPEQKKAAKIDLLYLLKLCFKSWKVFVIGVLACLLIALGWLAVRKSTYEVNAQLMLPRETSSGGMLALSDLASSFSMGDMFGSSTTDNEIAVIRSQTVFENTVRKLGLNTTYMQKNGFLDWRTEIYNPKLKLTTAPEMPDTTSAVLLFKVHERNNGNFDVEVKYKKKTVVDHSNVAMPVTMQTPVGEFTLDKTEDFDKGAHITDFRILFMSYNFAAQEYVELVKVFAPNKKTDFITLSFITPNPKFGKHLLNTIIDEYNKLGIQQKNDKSGSNLEFVDKRIATLEQELADAENNMERFKAANNITDPSVDASVLLQKSSAIEAELLQAQTENEILKLTLDFLSDPKNNHSLIPVLSESSANPDVPGNIASYNELILERMRIMSTLKVENDLIRVTDEQIDLLRQNIISTMKRAYANSNVKLADLKRENSQTIARIGSVPRIEREFVGLERDLVLKQQLYIFLLKQREEAQMSLEKSSDTMVTIDPPYLLMETPGLSKKMVLALAVLFGLMLALLYVYFVVMPKAPLPTQAALKQALDTPVLGTLSATPDEELPVLVADQGRSIRDLRSNVVQELERCAGKVVLVVSARRGDGKTYVADNLAGSLSMACYRTGLVDADMRHPMAKAVGNVDIIRLNADSNNPADVLASAETRDLLEKVKRECRYVVIDTPALDDYSDAFGLAEIADLTLFVVRPGHTVAADVALANSLMAKGRLPRVAAVINAK